MTGRPGRSGKLTTAAQKASAADRARKRWGQADIPPLPPGLDPGSDDPDVRLGKPVTWGDELKRQQVRGETIQNDRRQIEVQRAAVELARAEDERDEARGKLLTLDQHRERLRKLTETWLAHLTSLSDACLAAVPPEHQPAARHKLDAALAKYRAEVSEAVKS